MFNMSAERLGNIALMVVIVLCSTVLHEVSHAAMAYKLGDPTAKEQGRLTLNPAAHLDPVGSVLLPVLMAIAGGPIFAFAKPVPYNPNRLRKPIRDEVLVALAGPACNLVQALVGTVAFRACYAAFIGSGQTSAGLFVAIQALSSYVYLNLMLMFFNLIPLPPLDGSAIISPFLRGEARRTYYLVQHYSMPVLLCLLYLIPTVIHVDPVGWYLDATAGNLCWALLGV